LICSQSCAERGERVAAIVGLVHNAHGSKDTEQTRKRGRMRRGGTGERRHILNLVAEMVRETKFCRGVDDAGDPTARQQAVHGGGGFSAPGLVLRHFSPLKNGCSA